MLSFLRCLIMVLLTTLVSSAAVRSQPLDSGSPSHSDAHRADECSAVPVQSFEIVKTYPHDPEAFTQGLVYHQGFLYESTGLYGRSSLRKVEIESGKVLQSISLEPRFFGEGLALWQNKLVQLTWRSRVGFVYERDSFRLVQEFRYNREGWGLTEDGESLIMSDGSDRLIFLDPTTFAETREIEVRCGNSPVPLLNELEFVRGEIFANVYGKDRIARIAPDSGTVTGWIDLASLRNAFGPLQGPDVLNGIAYDSEQDRLFVTGKRWPKLFQIKLKVP